MKYNLVNMNSLTAAVVGGCSWHQSSETIDNGMVSRVSRVLANHVTIQHGKLGLHLCIPGESHNRYKPHLLEYKLKSAHFVYIICQSSEGLMDPLTIDTQP